VGVRTVQLGRGALYERVIPSPPPLFHPNSCQIVVLFDAKQPPSPMLLVVSFLRFKTVAMQSHLPSRPVEEGLSL